MGKKKCPFCQSKMILNNHRYRCVKCGYTISDSNLVSDASGGVYGNNPPSTQGGDTTAGMFNYEQNHGNAPRSGYSSSGTSKGWQKVLYVIGVILVVIGICTKYLLGHKPSTDYRKDKVTIWDDGYDTKEGKESFQPQSELFQQFVSEVFQKDYTEVTKEEYESITSIRFGNDNEIGYCIGDGKEVIIYFEEYLSGDMGDLNCFPGLKKLDISGGMYSLYEGDLEGVSNLEEIAVRQSPETLASLISNKEKIRSIKIGDNFMVDSLEGIEEFENLEALYIETGQISDLKNLSSLEHLETLVIEDGNRINNFGTLSSLKSLKKFAITSSGLKNIDFVEGMSQLEDVTICESSIKDIEPLREHKSTLKQLTLLENYDVTDYSVIDEFTQLEEASIGVSYDDVLPSLAGMTKMKKLYVDGAEDITFVGNAVNVTELTLSYSNLENLEVLGRLSNLKVLHINEARTYTKTLSPLLQLTGLEVLDISGTHIFGYVEELLSLPNLKEFYMDECNVAFDFTKLPSNENLKLLSMNEVQLIDYGPEYDPDEYYSNGEGVGINISDYAQSFQNFPNLTQLYLAGSGLENVEFAKELSSLEILDISDNYISSVAPLKELANLKVLSCKDNDIIDLSELGDEVVVIEE